ncbi:hypothetical protein ACSLO8_31010, partial [Escherichia coli]
TDFLHNSIFIGSYINLFIQRLHIPVTRFGAFEGKDDLHVCALKSSIAKWVLGMMSEGNNRQIRSAETFLVELFGSNYGDVIA